MTATDPTAGTADSRTEPSRFEYDPGVIRFGRGCVDELGAELAIQGADRAIVVCGTTVGSTPEVIDPVVDGLGDRLVDVYAETSPRKLLGTAIDGVERFRSVDADAIVSLGGGSSLDTAKALAVLAATERSPSDAGAEVAETGTLAVPEKGVPPIVAVPTTFAGADLSQGGGLNATPDNGLVDEPVSGGLSNPTLMPAAVFADPALFETTPYDVLAGSAMNGFDKGVETLYAPSATPITDATATRGLRCLAEGLSAIDPDATGGFAIDRAVEGSLLVQYGISRPGVSTLSLIHAFGHALRHHARIQQGIAHAIIAPHALAFIFEHVEGRRNLMARALDVPTEGREPAAIAGAIVDCVTEIRDSLGLPSRLRSVDGFDRGTLSAVAETTRSDRFIENLPAGLDPSAAELEMVLEAAW